MTTSMITTTTVCERLGLTEPSLRYVLRQPGAPRPLLHPTARLFLWCEADIAALADFIGQRPEPISRRGCQDASDQGPQAAQP